MQTGSVNHIPQSSPGPHMTATEINLRMQQANMLASKVQASWAEQVSKNFQSQQLNDIVNRPTVMPPNSKWEEVPWWMFWKDGRRRRTWRMDVAGGVWLPTWEYQHVAFVAREALEDYCAVRTPEGEGSHGGFGCASCEPTDTDRHRSASYVVGGGYSHRPAGS